MKIGIILHPYGEDKPAGLSRTIFELAKGMIETDTANEYIVFLKKKPRILPSFPGNNWKIEILGDNLLWLNRLKRATQCDTYLFNTPVLPLFWKPKRSIVLALDFAYYYFPPKGIKGRLLNMFTFWYHGRSLRRADGIVAISKATKKDVMELFHIPEQDIHVVLCGFKNVCAVPETPIQLPEKFFLFVGVMKQRKNVFNVVRAFREFYPSHKDYSFVLGGKAEGAYVEEMKSYIAQEGIEDNVHFIGHLNDGELSHVYRKAFALVFASFIEGFGYPVLEAMACGLPVITSKFTSLSEICQNGSALLVDPAKPEEITNAMEQIAAHRDIREELMRNGREQSKKFSWEKAGREMVSMMEKQ